MIIDAHCHIGDTPHYRQTAEELLEQMDRNGVGQAAICCSGRQIVVDNREGNDMVADAVRRYPHRFYGFAVVNPWYGKRGIEELRRAVGDGLIGLKLHPSMHGHHAIDPIAGPLIEAAIGEDLPIYVHTGTPVFSLPLQVVELALRYPEGRFIMGHMGGADFYVDVPSSSQVATNVYYETSLTCHVGYVDEILRAAGAQRVMFGSDSPTSQQAAELRKIELANLTSDERRFVLGESFLSLLPGQRGRE